MSTLRRRGRPALRESEALRSTVCVKFTTPDHDRLLKVASLKRQTLAELLRNLGISEIRKYKSTNPELR